MTISRANVPNRKVLDVRVLLDYVVLFVESGDGGFASRGINEL